MPLVADYADIRDYKGLHSDPDEFNTTEYISLMARQWLLPNITEDNYLEVYIRIHALETAHDEQHAERGMKLPYTTIEQVKRRIGLSFSGRWWGDESAKTWWPKFFREQRVQLNVEGKRQLVH